MVFLFLLGVFVLLFLFSRIRIEIKDFTFSSETKNHVNSNYEVDFKLNILGKFTIVKIKIDSKKLDKFHVKEKLKQVDLQKFKYKDKDNLQKRVKEVIKQIDIDLKTCNLKIDLGTENACVTSFIVPIIATVISIFIRKKIKKYENQNFIIQPIYQNRNVINIKFSGIFEIKLIHIINIIYILTKKGRVKKYERTSNRRSYDYGYE